MSKELKIDNGQFPSSIVFVIPSGASKDAESRNLRGIDGAMRNFGAKIPPRAYGLVGMTGGKMAHKKPLSAERDRFGVIMPVRKIATRYPGYG